MSTTNTTLSPAEIAFIEQAVQRAYGAQAKYETAEVVHEGWQGETMWIGEVHTLSVEHPEARHAYAWFYQGDDGRRRLKTVLGVGAVTSAAMAVRASIVATTPKPNKRS